MPVPCGASLGPGPGCAGSLLYALSAGFLQSVYQEAVAFPESLIFIFIFLVNNREGVWGCGLYKNVWYFDKCALLCCLSLAVQDGAEPCLSPGIGRG